MPVKEEAQTMHWNHKQVTIHSGILKVNQQKSYHPYFSDNLQHDSVFVETAMEKMIGDACVVEDSVIVVESDNCCSQYKSANHFASLQNISNREDKQLIRIWSIAGHGKGEVDHVGGVAKIAIRREVAAGEMFASAEEMTDHLVIKFADKSDPKYYYKYITEEELGRKRKSCSSYKTIEGSSKFQVAVFTPNAPNFMAAPWICICDTCSNDYGTCSQFMPYEIIAAINTKVALKSQDKAPLSESDSESEV